MTKLIRNLSRLCVHTITTKPWSLAEAIAGYQKAGVQGITVWRQHIESIGNDEAAKRLAESGMTVVSLCRGGFFPAETEAQRQANIDDNLAAIDTAQAIGAPVVVLVPGAVPGMPLEEGRQQIADGIAAVLPHAEAAGVKLAIEPLHPMYADSRSAVITLKQANDMAESFNHAHVGVTVDVYHVWWDPDLEAEIRRAAPHLLTFHTCDWRTPTRNLVTDRGIMGEGCIPLKHIRGWVEETGFDGFHEVEIFSEEYWSVDQQAFLNRITQAYFTHS
ncbi:MAG: sugar phosphate isomerase/epimerase family protein [Candidatus Hydrogenedentota bacterium]